jgi:hypothetical protein
MELTISAASSRLSTSTSSSGRGGATLFRMAIGCWAPGSLPWGMCKGPTSRPVPCAGRDVGTPAHHWAQARCSGSGQPKLEGRPPTACQCSEPWSSPTLRSTSPLRKAETPLLSRPVYFISITSSPPVCFPPSRTESLAEQHRPGLHDPLVMSELQCGEVPAVAARALLSLHSPLKFPMTDFQASTTASSDLAPSHRRERP